MNRAATPVMSARAAKPSVPIAVSTASAAAPKEMARGAELARGSEGQPGLLQGPLAG
jgi:hypothetical protein